MGADLTGACRDVSYWFDSLDEPAAARPALERVLDADVAVVGRGITGPWTAYDLGKRDPIQRVADLEAETAVFGASGRNRGWRSALFSPSDERIAHARGPSAARAMRLAMQETVDDVGRATAAKGVDCHVAKGRTVVALPSAAQLTRTRSAPATASRPRTSPAGRSSS